MDYFPSQDICSRCLRNRCPKMIPNRPLLSCAAYALAVAILSPIGVLIGIIINATTQGPMTDWIFMISMGLACGVFIYVSINHLLAKGYTTKKMVRVDKPFLKFLAMLFGVGVIAIVMIRDTGNQLGQNTTCKDIHTYIHIYI